MTDTKLAYALCDALDKKKCTREEIYEKYKSQLPKFMKYIDNVECEMSNDNSRWLTLINLKDCLRVMEWEDNGINGYINHCNDINRYEPFLCGIKVLPMDVLRNIKINENSSLHENLLNKIIKSLEVNDVPELRTSLTKMGGFTSQFLEFVLKEVPVYDSSKVGLKSKDFTDNLVEIIEDGLIDDVDASYVALVKESPELDYYKLMSSLVRLEKVNSEFAYAIFNKLVRGFSTFGKIPKSFFIEGLKCKVSLPYLVDRIFIVDESLASTYMSSITNNTVYFKSDEQFDRFRDELLEYCLEKGFCPKIVINGRPSNSLYVDYVIGCYNKDRVYNVSFFSVRGMTEEQINRLHDAIPRGASRVIDKLRTESNVLDNMPEIEF